MGKENQGDSGIKPERSEGRQGGEGHSKQREQPVQRPGGKEERRLNVELGVGCACGGQARWGRALNIGGRR